MSVFEAAEFDQHEEVLAARSDALGGCLEQLVDDDRQLLKQRYFEGVNLRQMAAAEGRSEDQLYRRLHRIRQALFKCIDKALAQQGWQ